MTANRRSRIAGLVRPRWRLAQRGRAHRQPQIVVPGSPSCLRFRLWREQLFVTTGEGRKRAPRHRIPGSGGVTGIREEWFQRLIFGLSQVLTPGAAPTAFADVLP
jgi:hypothetical protein